QPTSQPQLVDSAGQTVTALQTYFTDSGLISASFDLRGRPLGSADVRVVNPGNVQVTLPKAFTVIAGTEGRLVTNIIGPGRVRLGRTFTAYVDYRNDGDTDLIAPMFRVTGSGLLAFGLAPDLSDITTSLELIAVSPQGPAGILAPGATGRITLHGRA